MARTLDEAITKHKEKAKRYRILADSDELVQKSYCTGFDKYQYEKLAEENEQLSEWLEELKTIKEIDLSIPQHFTKEQSVWIKAYCIQRNKEFYNKAIDDFVKYIDECSGWTPNCIEHDISLTVYTLHQIAERLKEGVYND